MLDYNIMGIFTIKGRELSIWRSGLLSFDKTIAASVLARRVSRNTLNRKTFPPEEQHPSIQEPREYVTHTLNSFNNVM